jgi:hypothetical protein
MREYTRIVLCAEKIYAAVVNITLEMPCHTWDENDYRTTNIDDIQTYLRCQKTLNSFCKSTTMIVTMKKMTTKVLCSVSYFTTYCFLKVRSCFVMC